MNNEKEKKNDDENLGLYLNLKTFNTDKKGLFSLAPDRIKTNLYFIEKKTFFFRNEYNNINTYEQHGENLNSEESLISVGIGNDFKVTSPFYMKSLYQPTEHNFNLIMNKMWYVVNKNVDTNEIINKSENEDYYILPGDIIKLGTIIYIFSEIFLKNGGGEVGGGNEEKNIYDIRSLNKNKGMIFDICSQPKIINKTNYCGHIYFDLKEGKNSKKFEEIKNHLNIQKIRNGKVTKYECTLYECQQCKKFYPLRFKLSENSEVIDFIEIDKPQDRNYIILESVEKWLDRDKTDMPVIKFFYVITLTGEDEEITIGRKKNDNDIETPDEEMTISRNQAVLKYIKNKGKFLLKNKSDTSYTLVLIKNSDILISDKKEIYLQLGTTLIEAKVIKKKEFNEIEKKDKEKREQDLKKYEISEKDKIAQEIVDDFYN